MGTDVMMRVIAKVMSCALSDGKTKKKKNLIQ